MYNYIVILMYRCISTLVHECMGIYPNNCIVVSGSSSKYTRLIPESIAHKYVKQKVILTVSKRLGNIRVLRVYGMLAPQVLQDKQFAIVREMSYIIYKETNCGVNRMVQIGLFGN